MPWPIRRLACCLVNAKSDRLGGRSCARPTRKISKIAATCAVASAWSWLSVLLA
ncbi:MAG TPA: hypothetical protein VGM14_19875 [Streptosporangiaceae bacterium]